MLEALSSSAIASLLPLRNFLKELTTPISLSRTSRCCSKKEFSAGCCAVVDDEAGGRVVLDDIIFALVGFECGKMDEGRREGEWDRDGIFDA